MLNGTRRSFERSFVARARRPRYAMVPAGTLTIHQVPMVTGEAVSLELVDAHWSLSPQRGRETWGVVQAEVSQLRLCVPSVLADDGALAAAKAVRRSAPAPGAACGTSPACLPFSYLKVYL